MLREKSIVILIGALALTGGVALAQSNAAITSTNRAHAMGQLNSMGTAASEADAASHAQAATRTQSLTSVASEANASSSAHAAGGMTNSAPPALKPGTRINAILKSKLDARKARVGQPVVAESTDTLKSHGRVILPKHSKLMGHVTSVSTHGNSSLGVLFDQAVTPQGQQIPLHAGIRSVMTAAGMATASDSALMSNNAPPQPMPAPQPMLVSQPAVSAGGGLLGGVTSTVGSLGAGVTSAAAGSLAGGSAGGTGLLGGVASLPLQIRPAALSGGLQGGGSLLTSDRGFVHLDRGTHMQLITQSNSSGTAHASGPGASASGSAAASGNVRHP